MMIGVNDTMFNIDWIIKLPDEKILRYSKDKNEKIFTNVESLLEKNSRFPKFDPVSKICKEL
jgi:hypothetical protein